MEAEVHTLDGMQKFARAKIFVVAGGGIETPRLLLHSKSSEFPNGGGNSHDMVGRGFNDHPAVNLFASDTPHERYPFACGQDCAKPPILTICSAPRAWEACSWFSGRN